MVEQTPCPVCTLYLHPGMSLADHLETHPKEQVIKALVALAANSSSPLSSPLLSSGPIATGAIKATSTTTTTTTVVPTAIHKSQPDNFSFHTPPLPPPPPLVQRGFPQLPGLSSSSSPNTDSSGINNSRESKNGCISSSQRNLMIVNRQSTMVYQAGDHNQNILGQQITLAPPPLQLFNISSHNQGKFLTPPPAYGTAISQLRSNQNNHRTYSRHNQSQLDNSTAYCNNSDTSDQSALDFTITKNPSKQQNSPKQNSQQLQQSSSAQKFHGPSTSSLSSLSTFSSSRFSNPPRCRSLSSSPRLRPSPSPSPSVLRYAESPIAAHYVERENGDFIVQETPRHLVECVEKDDGEFSVVEKVICSPPSVLQFHDSNEFETEEDPLKKENQQHQQQMQQHQQQQSQSHSSDDETLGSENTMESQQQNINHNDETKKEIEQIGSPKQKKTVSGLTVISNVKLNPNESLDLMENIMASSNNNEVEVFWSGIVNPIIEKIENEEKERFENNKNNKNEEQQRIDSGNSSKSSSHHESKIQKVFTKAEKNIPDIEMEEAEGIKKTANFTVCNDSFQLLHPTMSSSSSSSSSSSVTTSVIRLASTPITIPSTIEITKISPDQKKSRTVENLNSIKKENENKIQMTIIPSTSSSFYKSNFSRDTMKKPPFRKAPKKLIVKFKNAPVTVNIDDVNNTTQITNVNENEVKENSSNKVTKQDKLEDISSILKIEMKEIDKHNSPIKCKLENFQQQKHQKQQQDVEINEKNNENKLNSFLEESDKTVIERMDDSDEIIEAKKEKDNENELDVAVTAIAPQIPAIQPMIVYESSLIEEPTIEDEGNNNSKNSLSSSNNGNTTNVINSEDKYQDLSNMLDNCWKNSSEEEIKAKLNEELSSSKRLEKVFTAVADVSSDNNSSGVNSLQITTEISISSNSSNIESPHQLQLASGASVLSLSSSSSLSPSSLSPSTITTLNSFPSTSNFSSSSSKPSTSSSVLQQIEQQQIHQNPHSSSQLPATTLPSVLSSSNYDYPFSFLYNNSGNIDKNRLSPIYPTELWKANYNAPIFQAQTTAAAAADFQDIEERERSSYIDLDSLKKANSSDAVQYCEALNIRTDEKMPAKGEISEQESNGDIENSWSQPLGGGEQQPYRFFNHIENYVARESWSDEGFICSQTVAEDIKPKPSLIPPSSSGEFSETQGSSRAKKPRKPRKSNSNNSTSTSTSAVVKKTKIFTCDHCPSTFSKLKDRNLHLIVQHDYKRVNRRLVREPPSATITSAEQEQQQQQQQYQLPLQNYQYEFDQIVLQQQQDNHQQSLGVTIATEDIKPDTSVAAVSSSTLETPQNFPRAKYDSIRAGVYRMLMNFNFTVLKEKQNIDVDEHMLESKTFCCFTCQKDFTTVKQFDEHLINHPAECFTCNRKFTRWSYFSIHLKRHLGWKDFECIHCNKRFVIRSALVEHMRMHTGISPLKCKLCGKCFKRYSNLTQHKRLCHSTRSKKKKEYVCYCGEVLPSKARFIWHREIHDTKPKCCPYCRDRFIHSNSLRRHIRLVHSDKFIYDQPAECPICNQVYAKNSLKGHMSTHSMDAQHECPICNKTFSTKWNLKIHSWVHANRTAKPFKCDMCIKAFVREIDYKNHINAHKQIKPFTCEYCGCKFIRKYNYLRHRREHHGQKKFRCELCGKQFHRHYYLIEHRRTHTGERPFLCTICGKSSTTKTNHNKHLKIHHSRDPFTSET